ncbi:MAG TPA: hypothetical protein VGM78_03620, partial [Ilumatobacteraceae bacterium]
MNRLAVWAPLPELVELETEHGRQPMEREESGWWFGPAVPAGERYRFVVDGEPTPDPRSSRQPEGPFGWSESVDHREFEWTDADWAGFPLASAVIYELHVGTFSPEGTFAGVVDRLDHLAALGITAIELMPVATFEGDRGWGYDGVNL